MKVYLVWDKGSEYDRPPEIVSIHETKDSADAERIRLGIAYAASFPRWMFPKELADKLSIKNPYTIEEYEVKQ